MKEKVSAADIISRLHKAYGIKEERGSLGALGKALGVSGSVVSGWKQPDRSVPKEKLATARADTGVRKEWLESGSGDMRPPPEINKRLANYAINGSAPVDLDLLAEAVAIIKEAEIQTNTHVRPEKLWSLIQILYDDYSKGEHVEPAKVIQMVRLAA